MLRRKGEYQWKFMRENNCETCDNITNGMRCTICRKVMINAHSAPCGCRYCLECVTDFLNEDFRFCPGYGDDCKQELMVIDENVLPDPAINQEISRLIVKCPRDWCEFTGALGKMEEHERVCEMRAAKCPYRDIGCLQNPLVNVEIDEHLIRENESHSRMLTDCIGRLRNEIGVMETDITRLELGRREQQRITEQAMKIEQLDRQMKTLKDEDRSMEEQIVSLRATNEMNRRQYAAQTAAANRLLAEMRTREQTQISEIAQLRQKCLLLEEKYADIQREILDQD